jgi:Major Facilitator Superfamily.
MTMSSRSARYAFIWVPSLFLAMGIPFNVINATAATMFKSLGISDGEITVMLGNVVLAWSLKPFWAAFLDMYRTKKFFVLAMEVLLAALFVGVAMALPMSGFFKISIALLWVAAFASSTQDICGDGIYLTALDRKQQATYAGIQSMAWNLGKVLATGLLISQMERLANANAWSTQTMWMAVWITAAVVMALLAVLHVFALPTGSIAHRPANAREVVRDFLGTAETVFHKRSFWGMIAFVFLYRAGEGLILMEGRLFLQSSTESGGLGLTAGQAAQIDGTWGTIAMIVGGILGGMFLGKMGLKRALPILALCLNVPHFTFVYLSQAAGPGHGLDYATIATLVSIEKFGYGFGFIGNMVYMMQQFAPGRSTMTHYAFATALMNFVLVPTTMVSGPLAEWLGFETFFIVVMFASVPSVLAAWKAPFPLDEDKEAVAAAESGREVITADDATRVPAGPRVVQLLAGKASIFAMLAILTLLIIDAKLLGEVQLKGPGNSGLWLGLLVASAAMKGFFAWKTFGFARRAKEEAEKIGETIYVRNARGAKIAVGLALAMTVGVLAVAVRLGL